MKYVITPSLIAALCLGIIPPSHAAGSSSCEAALDEAERAMYEGIGVKAALDILQTVAGVPCGFDLRAGEGVIERPAEPRVKVLTLTEEIVPCWVPGAGTGIAEIRILDRNIWTGAATGRWGGTDLVGGVSAADIGLITGRIVLADGAASYIAIAGVPLPSRGVYQPTCLQTREKVGEETKTVCFGFGEVPVWTSFCYEVTNDIYEAKLIPCGVTGNQWVDILGSTRRIITMTHDYKTVHC